MFGMVCKNRSVHAQCSNPNTWPLNMSSLVNLLHERQRNVSDVLYTYAWDPLSEA